MRLRCDRNALVDKLAILARGVSSRSALPVLSGVLLQAADGRLDLFSTDMELSIKASLATAVDEAGDTVVPARLFSDVVRNLPSDEVLIETEAVGDGASGSVLVSAGNAKFHLNAWAASDFPQVSAFDMSECFQVPREPFVATLAKVGRAASRDETRPILTGVLVSMGEGSLKMVATDSYRLGVRQAHLEGGPGAEVQAIVPVKALSEVARLATGAEREAIDVVIGENQALFGFGDVVVATRLIDGQFPNYKQLLPEAYEHEVVLDKEELLGVARRVGLLAQKNAPLRLRFGEGTLTVRAITQDVGQAEESLAVDYDGDEFEIGFNHVYLIDGIEAVDGDKVSLKLITPLRPGLVSGVEGEAAADFLYLIMPIRLSG
jgi:DNA polymerase-3 subunit beta